MLPGPTASPRLGKDRQQGHNLHLTSLLGSNTCRADSLQPWIQNLSAVGAEAVSTLMLRRTATLSESGSEHTSSSQGTTKLCLQPTDPGEPQS